MAIVFVVVTTVLGYFLFFVFCLVFFVSAVRLVYWKLAIITFVTIHILATTCEDLFPANVSFGQPLRFVRLLDIFETLAIFRKSSTVETLGEENDNTQTDI